MKAQFLFPTIHLTIPFGRDYLRSSRGLKSDTTKVSNRPSVNEGPDVGLNSTGQTFEIGPREILTYAWQTAKGMNYLSGMKVSYKQ